MKKKTVFIYIDVFSADLPFVNTWHLCRSPLNYSDPLPPNTHLFGTVKSMFFKSEVFHVITGCGKKKRNFGFLVWCAGWPFVVVLLAVRVRLLVVCGLCSCFLVFCGRLLVVCGRLLVVCVRLLVVCSRCLF